VKFGRSPTDYSRTKVRGALVEGESTERRRSVEREEIAEVCEAGDKFRT